ncbi:MAG: fused MFS/spermidine synthase [Gemmatimonadota bacterium]
MGGSIPDGRWLRAILGRAALTGAAAGVLGVAGSAFVLAQTGPGTVNAAVLVATILLAFAVGVWAGAPDATGEDLPMRERWVGAAAATAVAGAFTTFSILYQQFYPGPWWRIAGLLIVVALPFYVLGLLVPVLLTWSERYAERESDESAWGGLGPLVIGGLGAAAVASLFAGFLILPRLTPGTLLMAMAVLLLIPNFIADPAAAPSRENELYRTVTPYGSLQVTEVVYPGERQPERRLYLNGEEESGQLARSGSPTLAYIAAAESWLAEITPPGGSYLFLGGGGYTLPRRIVERDSRASATVVELDPEVTRIAERFFGLRRQASITPIHGDARAFLEREGAATFDRIYVDVYAGREALPHSMVTREAAESIARRLAPRGIAALNLIGDVVGEERRQIWSVVRTFAEVFPSVVLYTHLGRDFPERQNLLLALSSEPDREFPTTAGLFDRWPRGEWPSMEGTTVFTDLEPTRREPVGAPARSAREAS